MKSKFKCNYCTFKTNCKNLNDHIKTKHIRQGLVKCNWPECGKEIVKRYFNDHTKRMHKNTIKFKSNLERHKCNN